MDNKVKVSVAYSEMIKDLLELESQRIVITAESAWKILEQSENTQPTAALRELFRSGKNLG